MNAETKNQDNQQSGQMAPGIDYFAMPQTDLPYFRCRNLDATLSKPACAKMWTSAQTATGYTAERLETCRACPIGACHAGSTITTVSKLYGTEICPRCRRGAGRIIGGTRCVSCYNREREILQGRNAKGTAPSKLAPLFPIEVRFLVDGVPMKYKTRHARDVVEPMVAVLKSTKGAICFAFSGQPQFRQGLLF